MKFIADMGLAQSTTAFLRARGYDAVHLRDQGLQRLSDQEIVDKARAELRVGKFEGWNVAENGFVSYTHTRLMH